MSVESVRAPVPTQSAESAEAQAGAGRASPLLSSAMATSHDRVVGNEMLDTDAIAERLNVMRLARDAQVSDLSDMAQLPRLPTAHYALRSLISGLIQTVYVETDATHATVRPRLRADPTGASDQLSATPLVVLELPDLTDFAVQLPFVRS
jgi:hypothetical protein